jgi:putative ABC transport system permease protein
MNTIRVAFFLAWRQIIRSNKKSVGMIVAVMVLTFLNLVAVSGILVGLIEGSSVAYRAKYIGDLIVSPLENKKVIQDTEQIVNILKTLPEVSAYSVRYIQPGSIESNYNNRDAGKRKEVANGNVLGIKASNETKVTHWDEDILEGNFLEDSDTGKIVVGKNMLARYSQVPQDAERALGDVQIGDKVLVTINGKTNEFTLKGVINGKTDASRQAYISETDMKKLIDGDDIRASAIVVRAAKADQEDYIKSVLVNNDLNIEQKVETYAEGEPSFVKDLKKVFSILGTAIGSIGLVVAFITIFIVIYINAITRRKYIGIMKGIGINPNVIELSYIMQSIFYGISGSFIGALIVYFILIPGFLAHPIDFPFSDGIMVAPYMDTFQKFVVLMIATILAGYLPARSIVKQNTLNAILGR